MSTVKTAMTHLERAGARHLLVFNMPKNGDTPYAQDNGPAYIAAANVYSTSYDTAMNTAIAELRSDPTFRAKIYYVDVYTPLEQVVGWSVGDSLAIDLVSSALRQAIESRRPIGARLLHHSDQGCQYTSEAYRGLLNSMGIECSKSRPGSCHDNAVAERFFWSLTYEWTNHVTLTNLEDARRSVLEAVANGWMIKRAR